MAGPDGPCDGSRPSTPSPSPSPTESRPPRPTERTAGNTVYEIDPGDGVRVRILARAFRDVLGSRNPCTDRWPVARCRGAADALGSPLVADPRYEEDSLPKSLNVRLAAIVARQTRNWLRAQPRRRSSFRPRVLAELVAVWELAYPTVRAAACMIGRRRGMTHDGPSRHMYLA